MNCPSSESDGIMQASSSDKKGRRFCFMNKKFFGFTSVQLKYTAMFFMLLDHIGVVVLAPMLIFNENSFSPLYTFLRSVGRIAFPIFCFQLAEGFFHTKNRKLYFTRLLMFAIISEMPFNIAFGGRLFYPFYQNIFFTLSIGFQLLLLIFSETA